MKKLVLTLILITCVVSGCTSTKSEEPSGVRTDPKAAVIDASRKLIALKELSAIVNGEGQLAIRKDVEFVAPDRFHMKFDDATGAHVEMISIGKETYIKDGDSWNKMPGEDSPTSTFRESFTEEGLKTVSDVKFEGEETVNGKPALVYSYKLVTLVGSFPVTQKLWVDKRSGLPIKSYAEYTNSQVKNLTTVFDTETPVSIELPKK